MKRLTPLIKVLGIVFVLAIPFFLSNRAKIALNHQPYWTWLNFMPGANIDRSSAHLKYAVLQQSETRRGWHQLFESPLHFPHGFRVRLVLKEEQTNHVESVHIDGRVDAYAMDEEGEIFEFRMTGGRPDYSALTPQKKAEITKQLAEISQEGLVIFESKRVLEKFRERSPQIREAKLAPLKFGNYGFRGKQHLELKPDVNLRLGLVFSILVAVLLLVWAHSQTMPQMLRLALMSLTPFAVVGSLANLKQLPFGRTGQTGFVALLALISVAYTIRHLWKNWTPHTTQLSSWLRLTLKAALLLVGLTTALHTIYWWYLPEDVSYNDSLRYTITSLFAYDSGGLPLEFMSQILGQGSHAVVYPHLVSMLMTLCLWIIAPAFDQIYYPGVETGSVWLLYGAIIAMLHLCLAFATGCLAAHRLGHKSAVFLGILFTFLVIPSAHGYLHGAETFLWPIFAICLILGAIYRQFPHKLSLAFAVIFVGLLLSVKREAYIMLPILVLPWYTDIKSIRNWANPLGFGGLWQEAKRIVRRWWPHMLCLLSLSFGPFLWFKWLQIQADIGNDSFTQVSLLEVFSEDGWRRLQKIIGQFMISFSGSGAHFFRPPMLWISLVLCALPLLKLRQLRWDVPVSILFYLFGIGPFFYFFTKVGIASHIDGSWGRLMVPALISALFFVVFDGPRSQPQAEDSAPKPIS